MDSESHAADRAAGDPDLGQDKAYGIWSLGFLLAAWVMLEPRLRPVLILLPVAGMTGVAALIWQQPWL